MSPAEHEIHSSNRPTGIQDVVVTIAESPSEILAAAIAVMAPGRAALVSAGAKNPSSGPLDAAVAALKRLKKITFRRKTMLLEALFPLNLTPAAKVFSRAGFSYLTDLQYLTCEIDRFRESHTFAEHPFMSYDVSRHDFFARTVSRTYAQTLDCPELTGLRGMDDVLAGHRAAGEFADHLWVVAGTESEPLGVLLLSRHPAVNSLEIVYVGVVPDARRRGVGGVLLSKAAGLARRESATSLTLAVDRRNVPARRLYGRFGFREFAARSAWIATPSQF